VRVGVIIPVRNRPGLVLEALESVRAQTVLPDRVVVVDDGSSDQTPDRIARWLQERGVAGWELLRTEHRGAAEARQHGFLSMPEADLVAFLDSDDLWPHDFVRRALAVFERMPETIGASADRRTVDESTGQERTDDLRSMVARPMRWMVRRDAGLGSCTFLRAAALRSIGGYPMGQQTGHDIELFSGLLPLGRWAHLPGEAVTIRRHHAKTRREADHIYRQVGDANIRHARLYEKAVASMPPRDARSPEVRRAMARRWLSAAKTAYRMGDTTGAAECLSRVRKYQTISLRAARLKWKLWASTGGPGRTRRS
jgi:glycosyltransferase involved in cell wall biosynthesis